jgi:hypothetical protein
MLMLFDQHAVHERVRLEQLLDGTFNSGGWVVLPFRSNIPRSALCATLDTYNFILIIFC